MTNQEREKAKVERVTNKLLGIFKTGARVRMLKTGHLGTIVSRSGPLWVVLIDGLQNSTFDRLEEHMELL